MKDLFAKFDAAMPRGWKVALLALLLIGLLLHFGRMGFSAPVWLLAKILVGGLAGYVLDRMAFPNDRPHTFDADTSPELKAAAWRRRATIMAGCAFAAGVSA